MLSCVYRQFMGISGFGFVYSFLPFANFILLFALFFFGGGGGGGGRGWGLEAFRV